VNSRVLRAAAAVLALVALTAACGDAPAQPAAPSAPAAPGGSATDAFPVTVTGKMGTTVIPAGPQRVVTVGLRDQDFALALGVQPVGVAEWYPEVAGGIGPWAKEAVGTSAPKVVASIDSVNIEAVAALQPDLILSIYAASDPSVYGKLSKIAPTVTAPVDTEDYALSWEQQLTQTGAALGQSAKAAALAADLNGKIAAVKAAHPEFSGQSVIYGGLGGEPGAYTSTDQRGRFMTSLGFTIPAAIDGLATPEEAYFVGISKENYRMFGTDVAVIVGSTADPAAAVAAEPLYGDLANVREGRAVFLDELNGVWAAALAYDSPLSLPYTLDNFVPALAAAADKNPATVVPAEPPLTAAG
jgi:iron complex transport system substrate-binding protein